MREVKVKGERVELGIDMPQSEIIELNGHAVALRKIQCIGPVENGRCLVTLVSGWELPVDDSEAGRHGIVARWREYLDKNS